MSENNMTFEQYLEKVFTDQYIGHKALFEDALDDWMGLMSDNDKLKYADGYGEFMFKLGGENANQVKR